MIRAEMSFTKKSQIPKINNKNNVKLISLLVSQNFNFNSKKIFFKKINFSY